MRIIAHDFTNELAPTYRVKLKEGEYVQGCLVDDGVFAVTEARVKVVTKGKLPVKQATGPAEIFNFKLED